MAMQASRLNDDKYLHWLRTSLSLLYLKEGLVPLCDGESTQFHKGIRGKFQLKSLFADTSTCNTCTYKDIKKTKKFGVLTWHIQCGSNICNEWLDEILLSHKDYPCPDIAWANSDPQLWPTDVWEVSKLFQPYGCVNKKSASESDCQGLLRLLKTCTHFHQFLSNRAVLEQINDVRNACMHSSSLQIEDAEMKRGLNLMISLLEQPHLKHRTSCVEAKRKIIELRDNLLDISLNKELELQALNHKMDAVRNDVDRLEAELQQLQTSLNDITTRQDSVTTRQDTTAEEYRQMCERIRELGQNIPEIKTSQEQHNQAMDKRFGDLDVQTGTTMADLTSRLQELETNSNKEIERLEDSFQSTVAGIETRLGNLETQRVAQQTDQPVDIKGLQRQLISIYNTWNQHFPVYLLRSERKIRLEDIYVEQRLKVVDPDGKFKDDCKLSEPQHTRFTFRGKSSRPDSEDKSKDESEHFISSLRDVFFSEGKICQYVYISGNAGYGKSVFCNHLVSLWCKAHSERTAVLTPDEESMSLFPLLFCVDLRDAQYDSNIQMPDEICSLILKQLQLSGIVLSYDYLSRLLQAEGQVLVVMDALDECKEERLPRGGRCHNCTTLVTSRPWKLEALRRDPEYMVDKELEIVGLKKGSPENLAENLVKLLNKKWNKSKKSEDFIQMIQRVEVQEFLEVPVLLTAMLCLWFADVPFGQSQGEVYNTSIHHQILAAVKAKDIPDYSCPSEVPFPICQREKCPCKCYGELFWKVSELACKALLGNVHERSLVMDHDQTEFLGLTDKEIAITMKLGILTQYKLLGNVTDYEPQKSVSFTHKTYQEWFVAIYLSSNIPVSELENQLSEAINDLDSALELDQLFLFVCGLNEQVALKLNEFINSMVSSNSRVQEYRMSLDSNHGQLIKTIQDIIVAGAVEAKKKHIETTPLQLHDVYIAPYDSLRFSREQILACDTSQVRSVYVEGVFIQESVIEENEIAPWPASFCLEKLQLEYITNALDDTFCANFSAAHLMVLCLVYVTMTHDQLESLCANLASANSLRTVCIDGLTCITHMDNIKDCSIMLDLSQHLGLEHLTLPNLGDGVVRGVRLCQNMDKLEKVELHGVKLPHDQLESLCHSLASLGSLGNVCIYDVSCLHHKDNRRECNIELDFSQYVSFKKISQSWQDHPTIKITSWPKSSCMETVDLRYVDISSCDTFCDNFNIDKVSNMHLEDITLTHDQLERLCVSLATAENNKTLHTEAITCLTHKDNENECSIHLDFSQYVSFEDTSQSWRDHPNIKITSWPSSSCMETVDLRDVDISSCDTFCDNFNIGKVSNMYLEDVTMTHDQLESLCVSLALAGSLRTVIIRQLTCITHKDNRQDCSIILDLSQHQGLQELKLFDPDMAEVRGVSLCQDMAKLETVELWNVTLTHDQLESLCVSLALAGSLRIVIIDGLTCTTHKDNRQDCSIMLDLSRHQGLEKLTLWDLDMAEVRGVSLCQNIAKLELVNLCNVTLTHDQLESLCVSLALAGSFRTVMISQLTCTTHKDNRHDCSIMLDLSRHQGLEILELFDLGVGDVRGVSLCQNMAKLETVNLCNVTLTHDQLESLCVSLALAGSLRIVIIRQLTCITHKDNRRECNIELDFSQYVSFKKISQSWQDHPTIKITSWPKSSCMETVDLRYVDISSCDTFCDNFNIDKVSNMHLEDITLTHDQLERLCVSLATAENNKTLHTEAITCLTHKDNENECSIHLDFSQYVSFEKVHASWCYHPSIKITSWPSSSCMETVVLRGVNISQCDSFCDNFNIDNVSNMHLEDITLTHDQLEILCVSLATAENIKTLQIEDITCLTHKDNENECSIHLDFSQYVSFEDTSQSWRDHPNIKITSWPSSSCMETVDLRDVDISSCDTFCDNFNIGKVSNMYLEDVTMTHDQLESLCVSLALAGSLRTVIIRQLTCITHKDNRQDCSIILDLSQHQGLQELKLFDPDMAEVRGVSLCQDMAKLETVELWNVTLTHDQLESLCVSLALAGSLRIVIIDGLTCTTHKDNRQDCSIMLDLSRHQGLEKLTLWDLDMAEVRGVSLCQNIAKLELVNLCNVTLTHDQLESLCVSLALAGSLRTVMISQLTCTTHKDNRHDCSIMLDLSRHQGLEILELFDLGVGEVRGVSLCQNMAKLETVELWNVTLTHDQLESLCVSLALAGSLRIVIIRQLTCITHKDNRQDCSIMLDLSRHQGLEELTLWDLDMAEVRGVSLCQNMAKLELVNLCNVTLTHDQLESLCVSLALAGSLRTVIIRQLTCLTHKDNENECSIHLDFSQYVSFEDTSQSWRDHPNIKITSWPSSSCMETVDLRDVDISSCDTFCDNFNIGKVSNMYLEDVTMTHDQLESLCVSLALAGSLRTVIIRQLTCITHKDNRQDCSIILDLSRHQGLEKLTLWDLDMAEVRGVSLCQNMAKLKTVVLEGFCISAGALRQTLETLPENDMIVVLGGYDAPLRVRGAVEARKLLKKIGATHTDVVDDDDDDDDDDGDDVEYIGDECVVKKILFFKVVDDDDGDGDDDDDNGNHDDDDDDE